MWIPLKNQFRNGKDIKLKQLLNSRAVLFCVSVVFHIQGQNQQLTSHENMQLDQKRQSHMYFVIDK